MSSTSSRPGVQTADWVKDCLAENQQQSQLTLRGSKPEGSDTQEQVMPSPGEDIYCPPRAWENWFMIGLLYRMLKSLLHLVLLRRLEQNEANIPADPLPEPRPGTHTIIGNCNDGCGNVQRSGNITITCEAGKLTESGTALVKELAGGLLAVSAIAGHGNTKSSGVDDSAGIHLKLT